MIGREREGYIDSKLLSSALPRPDESSHRVLVCGGPSMVMGVLQGLHGMGYSSEKIFVYGQFGVQQIKAVYGKFAKLAGLLWDLNSPRDCAS